MRLLASGKVKDIYEYDGDHLLFRFSDRVSAYDVRFEETVPRKGEVLCRFAEYWFGRLTAPSHFVRRESDTEIVVKRMEMIPMECVVRGYLYGSLARRWRAGEARIPTGADTEVAARLPEPVFDPTTKSEHDVPVGRGDALRTGLVETGEQFDRLSSASIGIYREMAAAADSAGFIMADLKLEFGILDGEILLGDSMGPDEYRLWPRESYRPGRVQESYDKQILRDWLTEQGHAGRFDEARAAGRDPVPPPIPAEIVDRMARRYLDAYRRITGLPL